MKTELGISVAVLSALAAQGKDFDRTELNAMLDRLAASPEPKIEPDAGAMCYEMAESRLESYEHQCRKCGAKTVYPPDRKEWRRYLRTLRDGALSLKAKGLNIELDDSCLCRKCGKEVFIAGESGLSITNRGKIVSAQQAVKGNIGHPDRFRHLAWVINGRRIDARSSDVEILSAFLSNKRIVTDEFDNQEPLKKYLPRLRALLGETGKE